MRVGLVDVDSHNYPNLVLMKLSAWHKSQGHEVELLKPADVLNGSNLFYGYDELIGACVFDWNRPVADALEQYGVRMGGTGTLHKDTLPDYIEHIMPDYSLYGITDVAYGHLSRGCPRSCPFCIVAGKEGTVSHKVGNLTDFWSGQKEIQLMDPNILACADRMELLQQLSDCGAWVEFNQGLDARLLTDDVISVLKQIKVRRIHFAWDNPRDKTVQPALERFAEAWGIKPKDRSIVVYVLVNYWSTMDQDIARITWLRDRGYAPFVMVYDKPNAPEEIRHMQRWCNNRWVFYRCKNFEDYDPKK